MTPTSPVTGVLRRMRRGLLLDGGELSDRQLLGSFVAERDEAAFAALVRRHGPMVLGVCRRILGNVHDAEDAFQATFLVLARRAAVIVPREMVANWLHGVARRTAWKTRVAAARRRTKEREAPLMQAQEPPSEAAFRDWQPVLDQELERLPDKYRVPIVLCDLEGRNRKQAAQHLGWPEGTLSCRLARGRALLAQRLRRRGLTLASGGLAVVFSQQALSAAVPAPLVTTTVHAATSGTASAPVAALAEGVIKAMLLGKLKSASALTLSLVLVVAAGVCFNPALIAVPLSAASSRPTAVGRLVGDSSPPANPAPPGRIYYQMNQRMTAMAPDGKDAKLLPGFAANDDYYYQPRSARLSPDGKRLAFGKAELVINGNSRGVYPPNKIYVRDVNKSEPAELVVDMPGVELHNWVWSPDGNKLAFVSWDKDNPTRNWIVDLKTKKVAAVTFPKVKTEKFGEIEPGIQDWSPDGAWFALGAQGLYLAKTDGSGMRKVTEGTHNVFGGSCRFSPDGKRLLFVTYNENKSNTLYTVDVAGGPPKAVVDAMNFSEVHAVWSPDSRRIAYVVTLLDGQGNRGEETSLNVIDADGSNSVTLITEKHEPHVLRLTFTDWR